MMGQNCSGTRSEGCVTLTSPSATGELERMSFSLQLGKRIVKLYAIFLKIMLTATMPPIPFR